MAIIGAYKGTPIQSGTDAEVQAQIQAIDQQAAQTIQSGGTLSTPIGTQETERLRTLSTQPKTLTAQPAQTTPPPNTNVATATQDGGGQTTQTTQPIQPQATATQPAPQPTSYVVKSGDTLSMIAQKFGFQDYKQANITGFRSGDPNLIFPGETLTIGAQATPQTTVVPPADITQLSETQPTDIFAQLGIPTSFTDTSLDDIIEKLSSQFGLTDVNEELSKLNSDFADKVQAVNDNPWLSEALRSKKIVQEQDKYETKKQGLVEQLRLRQDVIGKAIDLYQSEKEYKKDLLFKALDLRQKQLSGADQPTSIQEYQFAVNQGYKGSFLDYQRETANLKVTGGDVGAKSTEETISKNLGNYNLVNEVLNDPELASVSGASRFLPQNQAFFSKTATVRAKVKQLSAILSLENRQQLKGSGAISDFESRVLQAAASSLSIDSQGATAQSDEAFRSALAKVKGVFANAAGLPSQVKIIDPRTGKSKYGSATRSDINSAISQGYVVEYQ